MTTTVPEQLLADLDSLWARAACEPTIGTSAARIRRLGTVVSMLKRAAEDLPPGHRATITALLDPQVIGHPDQPETILGRAATGRYRTRANPDPLTPATQRALMDGIADLNRAAGHPPYWWQRPGNRWVPALRPWANHTLEPMANHGHIVLRRALSDPYPDPRREAFRLRTLAMLELLWATAVEPDGLAAANVTDLTHDLSEITLTFDPPGRTEAVTATVPLGVPARAAIRQWLPVRRRTIDEYLEPGSELPSRQALFVTLRHTHGLYAETGLPRRVPPGLRITATGLLRYYAATARRLNSLHTGQDGWPVPTNLYQITRGAAAA